MSLISGYTLFSVIVSVLGSLFLIYKEKHLTLFDTLLIFMVTLGLPFLIPVLFLAGLAFILEKLTNKIIIYGRKSNIRTLSIH